MVVLDLKKKRMEKPLTVSFEVDEKKAGVVEQIIQHDCVEVVLYITQKQMNEYVEYVLEAKGYGVSK